MATEKILIFDEQGNAKRMKVRIARFLDNEPVTAADKTNIRTTLDVDDSLSGTFTTPLSVTSASDSSFTGGGKVGIGGTPNYKLDVKRTDAAGDYLYVGASSDGGQRGLKFTSADNGEYLGAAHTIDAISGGGSIAFATGGTTRATIDSLGNVKLAGDETELQFNSDTGIGNNVRARIQCEGKTGTYGYGGDLVFKTTADNNTSAERVRITNSALVLGSGVGIDFGSVAGGVGTPTPTVGGLLDDFETGSWSPVIAPNSGSFATSTTYVYFAKYTKVGNLVTANCYIRTDGTLDTTGGSSVVRVEGLPFASPSTNYVSINVGYAYNWSAAPAGGYIPANTNRILLSKRATSITGNLNTSDVTDLDTGGGAKNEIMLSVTYQTA